MSDPRELDAKTRTAIAAVFENLPNSYPAIHFQLEAISAGMRANMARLLEPLLNAALESQKPAQTLNEARMVADKIDSDLAYLGLCVAFNGEPALLVAERGDDVGAFKYAILVRTDQNPWFTRALVADNIPHLSLIPAPANFEHYAAPLRKHAAAYLRGRGA